MHTITGYSIRDIQAQMIKEFGCPWLQTSRTFHRGENRRKTIEELWKENGSWVRYDLCVMARWATGTWHMHDNSVVRIKPALLEYARRRNLRTVSIKRTT